jgi:hypothetical protein
LPALIILWQAEGRTPPPLVLGGDADGAGPVMSWEGAELVEPSDGGGGTSSAPLEPPPPSCPPSPAHNEEPMDESDEATKAAEAAAEAAAAAADAIAAQNAIEAGKVGGYPCLWSKSGLRGVYERASGGPSKSKKWEAVLPMLTSKGRSEGTDVFGQKSLGFFGNALEAAAAFAAAASAAAAAEPGVVGERYLRRDPISPLLEPKVRGTGLCGTLTAHTPSPRVEPSPPIHPHRVWNPHRPYTLTACGTLTASCHHVYGAYHGGPTSDTPWTPGTSVRRRG